MQCFGNPNRKDPLLLFLALFEEKNNNKGKPPKHQAFSDLASAEKPLENKQRLSKRPISEEFQKPQPLLVSEKVLQNTSNLYGSTPPICIAVPSWLLILEERETQQYTSHLYCSTPPTCTAVRPPFVRQYFWKILGVRATGTFLTNATFPCRFGAPMLCFTASHLRGPAAILFLAWPPLQSLAVKKNFFLCKFWAVKNF